MENTQTTSNNNFMKYESALYLENRMSTQEEKLQPFLCRMYTMNSFQSIQSDPKKSLSTFFCDRIFGKLLPQNWVLSHRIEFYNIELMILNFKKESAKNRNHFQSHFFPPQTSMWRLWPNGVRVYSHAVGRS